MANQNPDIIDGSGKRQIASYYYPLIGPYASGDPDLVEYQLLLMKLSGVDGVLIDWPGTTNAFDYARNKQNSEAIIAMLDKVGMQFAIVYEDNNLNLAGVADKVGQARNDMNYAQSNYFTKSSYIKINNAPLLMDFGPQALIGESNWTNAFSGLNPKPTFLTLWYEHDDAGANCKGEYSWIYSDYLTGLDNFYANRTNYGTKMASAYPGFNAFYAAGGWDFNWFQITQGTKSASIETDINEVSDSKMLVYPNPTSDVLYINMKSNSSDLIHAKIYNLSGALVLEQNIENNVPLNISNLKAGAYLVKALQNNTLKTQMIIKK
jgi:hypothetical protein